MACAGICGAVKMSLKIGLAMWTACSMLAASGALAQTTGLALAKSKACMACHQLDVKRVGPPLNEVAARYGGNSNAVDYLAARIRNGGRGAWGAVPMPAQNHVKEDDARQLALWILSLQPAR